MKSVEGNPRHGSVQPLSVNICSGDEYNGADVGQELRPRRRFVTALEFAVAAVVALLARTVMATAQGSDDFALRSPRQIVIIPFMTGVMVMVVCV